MTTARYEIRLTPRAREVREGLHGQAATRMDNAVRALATRVALRASAEDRSAIRRIRRVPVRGAEVYSVWFDRYIAACEVIRKRQLLLVYAVTLRREVDRHLCLPPRWTYMEAIPTGWGLSSVQLETLLARNP